MLRLEAAHPPLSCQTLEAKTRGRRGVCPSEESKRTMQASPGVSDVGCTRSSTDNGSGFELGAQRPAVCQPPTEPLASEWKTWKTACVLGGMGPL